ncbi:Glycerol kinase [Choanephora cucurbitarum]|uniref:glycerol kinase n=1 Tax=Choanephora cucurbitarum TaxID=101091 RepID=A0A1C7NPX1_9FUNG|nr:Glycerol kinase [Choanephora cucurbitarum]
MPQFIGSIDQGTTSTRFVIFNEKGQIVTFHQMEFEQSYPQPGWVEHDPYELLDSVHTCIEHAISKLALMGYDASDIKCIGLTNQRETLITWDALTGHPLYPAIIWSDARTIETVEELAKKSDKGVDALKDVCGLPLATYFTGVKLRWLLDNVPVVSQARNQNRLRVGTVDTWLIYNLTGGLDHNGVIVTDVTNASRTMLMDIHTLNWSPKSIEFFGFEQVLLPRIVSSSEVYGTVSEGSLTGVPIAGCLGDQQAALVGQQCFEVGDAKNTYGTGCFMLFNTGNQPVQSKNGLLTTVAYKFGDAEPAYALEGSVAVAGSSINWLRDNLGVIADTAELNTLASQVSSTSGIYFVTGFAGLFAPYWRSDARGTICGITHFTRLEHICRATLEAVCYQSRAILEAMNMDAQSPLRSLKVDGGMSNSDLCMQIQADVLGIQVDRPSMRETTALGSAIAAGFAMGIWKSFEELSEINKEDRTYFESKISEKRRNKMVNGWEQAVKRSYGWANANTTAPTHDIVLEA